MPFLDVTNKGYKSLTQFITPKIDPQGSDVIGTIAGKVTPTITMSL